MRAMEDVTIRAARPDDAEDVAAYMAQPSVVWGTLQLPIQSAAAWRTRFEGNSPDTSYVLVAEVASKAVGLIGLHWGTRPRTRHVAHLGMTVSEQYQGRGIGKALMGAALDAADRWLNLVRVELEVYPDNERAVRLYQQSGFELEGRKRLNAWRDGQYVDSLIMGRLRPGTQG
jgi:putative acetyltransferase